MRNLENLAYRGIVPDEFLDRRADSDRREFWTARFTSTAPERRLLLQALGAGSLLGFVSVLLDAEPKWGARLDSLHVSPASGASSTTPLPAASTNGKAAR